MRKTYMMLLALVLTMLGVSDAMAQKIYRAELDKSMFKAWNGTGADAQEVEPTSYVGKGDATVNFACETNFYKTLDQGAVVFGNTNVYSRWYADLTGTKKIFFKGDAKTAIRVLMNRPDAEPGAEDPNGGTTVEQRVEIGADGTGELDVTGMEYVHLNCIKIAWGSAGVIKSIELEGTVKPVTGLLSMINNGDAEGDDLSSFPVSLDGPNNGDSAPDKPEIVEGEGVNGSRCFKVTAFDSPTETWHTQFYIKADEVMPKGTKWQLKMSVKADQPTNITTSAQGQPRQWKGGMVDEFGVTTEWRNFTWSGEIGVDDFQSIAFDLSNANGTPGNGGVNFYFDNIEFATDLGGSNPLSAVELASGTDVIRVNLGGLTNMKDLVKAAPTTTLVYDNSTVSITVDGKPFDEDVVSVEGYEDGNLYIFIGSDIYDNNEVKVAFKNPEDAAHRLLFTSGKWEGQPVPDFSGLIAPFDQVLAESGYVSYLYNEPALVEINPEKGSFNLPGNLKEFTLKFNQVINVSTVVAKLGNEDLVASGDSELSEIIKLTRTSDAILAGVNDLVISAAEGQYEGFGLDKPITVEYSFGAVDVENAGEIETLIDPALFQNCANDQIPEGYFLRYQDAEDRVNGTGYGSGARMFEFAAGGDFTKGLYMREGYLLYGNQEGHNLTLTAGKKYTIHFNSAMWKDNGKWMKFDIFTQADYEAEGEPLYSEMIENTPNMNGQKTAVSGSTDTNISFTPEADGDYILRWTASDADGKQAYSEILLANVSMKFIPNLRGLEETIALNGALADAKNTRDTNNGERYAGEAFTALDNLIKEVEANKGSYSAPSVYIAKTDELKTTAKALADHVALCDEYDKLPQQAFDLWVEKKESKFVDTEYFKNLVTAVEKYCTYGDETTLNEETGEEVTTLVLKDFVKYYTTAELNTAKKELSDVITMASKWLTEGPSTKGWNQITTGYAALHERIRRGVELLKSLGVADDDPLIVQADAELGDNDEIAEAIAFRAKSIILEDLAKGEESTLFASNAETGETPAYDLSVFFKNPNCYGPANSTEVPGWTSAAGNGFAWSSWDGAQNHSANTPYPEDCDIHAGWHPNPYAIVEQTVSELPAGTYVVTVKCNDNGNSWNAADDENPGSGTCAFVRTSANPAIESGAEVDREVDFAAYLTGSGDFGGEDGITIEDGQLTVGFYYGNTSQAFFEEITSVKLIAPLAGHDYKNDKETSIETAAAPSVRSILVYDLNGRRVIKANKGLQIVKKQMSDGSVRVEKVVK